jgi:hypothetical protein
LSPRRNSPHYTLALGRSCPVYNLLAVLVLLQAAEQRAAMAFAP